jgi:hypothetical protein
MEGIAIGHASSGARELAQGNGRAGRPGEAEASA